MPHVHRVALATKVPFGWRSGKVREWKIVGGWKSERIENI